MPAQAARHRGCPHRPLHAGGDRGRPDLRLAGASRRRRAHVRGLSGPRPRLCPAARLALRPADARRSYGYDRFQILVAYSNGLVLFGITAVIVYEAWRRFSEPVEILAGRCWPSPSGPPRQYRRLLRAPRGRQGRPQHARRLLHVFGDLLGSVAPIVASLVILATGWTQIDPILSVLVCLLILTNAWRLVRESAHVLLEGAPAASTHGGRRRPAFAHRDPRPGSRSPPRPCLDDHAAPARRDAMSACPRRRWNRRGAPREGDAERRLPDRPRDGGLEHGRCADAGTACGGDHVTTMPDTITALATPTSCAIITTTGITGTTTPHGAHPRPA